MTRGLAEELRSGAWREVELVGFRVGQCSWWKFGVNVENRPRFFFDGRVGRISARENLNTAPRVHGLMFALVSPSVCLRFYFLLRQVISSVSRSLEQATP